MSFPKKTFAVVLLVSAPHVWAAQGAGNLVGWVEDPQGLPVPNVLISLFSKGMRDGGFVTFSDGAGRFALASIPAGAYTLRAVDKEHAPARPRQITVVANRDSIFAISLKALQEVASGETPDRARELQWLERHKRRSVLEDDGSGASGEEAREGPGGATPVAWLSDMSTSLAFVAEPSAMGSPADSTPNSSALPPGSGVVTVKGRIGESASFSVGGLVGDGGNRPWRTAGEFLIQPGGGHEIQAGVGYGTILLGAPAATDAPIAESGAGSAFLEDRWDIGDRVTVRGGVRESFIGFVADRNHVDPSGSLEIRPTRSARILASFGETTVVPGGDIMTVSSFSIGPPIAYASISDSLRPQSTLNYALGAEQRLGDGAVFVRAFRESTQDQLLNVFDGSGAARTLRIVNDGDVAARGIAIGVSEHVGRALKAGVTYEYGRLEQGEGQGNAVLWMPATSFHDLAAHLEAAFGATDTRLYVYYRFDMLQNPEMGLPVASRSTTRFDVQITQGLPFLGTLTRADWDLLVAFRNLFYDAATGGVLDEVAVVNPPKRLLGGISVRF